MTFPRYNFVIDCTDAALAEYLRLDTETAVKIYTRGDLNWCLQTYHILSKHSSLAVQCSNKMLPGFINIIHSDQLLQQKGQASKFIVCVRADYPGRRWAHYHLVQNKNQLGPNTSFIPHWVQPGLIKRDANRTAVSRVAYAGEAFNGNLAGTVDTWKQLLAPHNIQFVTLSGGSWHDLSSIDILLGIRSFDEQPHNTKPPTKLFGAWHANIPFIGGHDSAFKQVGVPGEDYLLVTTPDEAIAAILKLRDDQALYNKLVQNGRRKATLYTEETIAQAWVDVLTGPVLQRYRAWLAKPFLEQARFNTLLSMGNLEHQVKQLIKKVVGKKMKSAI
ncbi:hypothetical protein AAE02nite_15990 [Adhaeribacter aerolatus]|uniref:Glycosyltransferase family 1 protein n=1 Tax=Adhaeribacter aerolatus TaxID=670289 RepID=A0A512AW50_9BACT|nr:glycosyltransferase family 4 protein [Adhaeribacter aerolatus]GEO03935.1 hypothetical protein AAE02nite_15990 [Adhaeribacter aerolatus]